MKIKFKNSEFDKIKKIYVALGLDTKKIDSLASKKGVVVKTDTQIKAELKAEIDKVKT